MPKTSDYKFTEQTTTALDANDSVSTTTLDIKENKQVAWTVLANSGAHTTHIFTLQCSMNGTNWSNTTSTITGVGTIRDNVQITGIGTKKIYEFLPKNLGKGN